MTEGPIAKPDRKPSRKPSRLSRIVRWIILRIYRSKGWRIQGYLPDISKYVVAAAPHASSWDFVLFIGATAEQGVRANFMGKHTLFNWPITNFMFDMGGISIDRNMRANAVEQVAEEFERRDKLALVIAAEGTRSSTGEWRSGFYHIAQAAGVPIVPTWVCYERKLLGFGPPMTPTGNFAADLAKIAAFMRSKLPDYERYKVLEAQAARLMREAGEMNEGVAQ